MLQLHACTNIIPGGGTPRIKEILIVSLKGVNFGFRSHFIGCSGQNTIIFSREGLV